MKKTEPYIFEEGQLIAYKYRGVNEYAKTELRNGSHVKHPTAQERLKLIL
jgi:hypothetical protein